MNSNEEGMIMLRRSRRIDKKEDSKNLSKKPLLVRSLSDGGGSTKFASADHQQNSNKALTLSLSESRLLKASASLWDLKSVTTCSCGCNAEEEEETLSVFSEDEGCFVIAKPIGNDPIIEEQTNKEQTSTEESKCIYIDSVDSGRSSDSTGTHQSWTSSTSSKCSAKSSPKVNHHGVHIVPHTFCDYLGSIKRASPTSTASSSYASLNCQKNKVRVYVPYSTIIALTSDIRETPVDDIDEDFFDEADEDQVVICDTQVVLRINPDHQAEDEDHRRRRMTKKLLNEAEAFDKSSATPSTTSPPLKIPKRKDLCKLLGLNEQDVDLMIVPEVKVAQKVALSHSAMDSKHTAKKKDLAKFLGVEEQIASAPSAAGSDTASIKESSSASNGGRPKSLLINWGQMVKSSVKGWKFEESDHSDMEMDVPVQLRQIPAKEPERTHRKDLSKFLGLDDSDSEEIVFIRNAQPSLVDDSSLARKSTDVDNDSDNSDDSVGSLRSFDSFVRRSLRCGASSEFASHIHIEEKEKPPQRGDCCRLSQDLQEDSSQKMAQLTGKRPNLARRAKKDASKRAQEVSHELLSAETNNNSNSKLQTMDRKPVNPRSAKEKQKVAFGPNSRRLISPVRKRQSEHKQPNIPPVFMREEPLLVYPQKPPIFYQHYPMYQSSFGILPPGGGGRINPNNGRIRMRPNFRPMMN